MILFLSTALTNENSSLIVSAILGFLSLCLLLLFCLIIVLGVKAFILLVKEIFSSKNLPLEEVKPQKPKRTKLRSIEIDPEKIDKIFVRKSL